MNKVRQLKKTTLVIFCIELFMTTGCAYQYVDSQGSQHIVGLVNVSIDINETCGVPNKIEVTTVGLSAVSLPSHGGITLGYSHNSTVILRGDTTVNTN